MTERASALVGGPAEQVSAAPPARPGLPPGPRLPLLVQTLLAVFATERYSTYVRRHYDSMARLRAAGFGELVVVWEPSLIKQLLTGDPDVLRGGESNARFLEAPAGESSVMLLDGERHLRMRRLLSPPFHGEAVRRYGELVARATAEEVERWPVGETLATRPRMQAITLEVILGAVIGTRDERRLARMRTALGKLARAGLYAFAAESAYPGLAASPLGRRLPWIRARHQADVLLREEIAEHRAEPDGREDVLALLMAAHGDDVPLSDDELIHQLRTLLVAGHESTATALSWCFERLVRHPEALARLRDALAGEDADRHLEAVVNETLRLRPVVDAAGRKLSAPLRLGGYVLPAGTSVVASINGVQHSDVYADPYEFRPERFLDGSVLPYALIPFGGGTHRCLGASFAMMEMKTILREVLERVELRAPTPRPERQVRWKRITVVPSRDGQVLVSARRRR